MHNLIYLFPGEHSKNIMFYIVVFLGVEFKRAQPDLLVSWRIYSKNIMFYIVVFLGLEFKRAQPDLFVSWGTFQEHNVLYCSISRRGV